MPQQEQKVEFLEPWWLEAGYKGVCDVVSGQLSDDESFWLHNLVQQGPGPYTASELESAFEDRVTDGGSQAFARLVGESFLVKSPGNESLQWSWYVKMKALIARPVPDGWKPGDADPYEPDLDETLA